LPFKGTEPNAYIIVCSTVPENKWVDIDLGISSQSMLLKAVEIGLNGICIGAFNKNEIVKQFNLKLEPILIIAIGKGLEKIQILPISQEDNINYFRENGIHYVPKIKIDNLII
jgi:Nitroreductase family.